MSQETNQLVEKVFCRALWNSRRSQLPLNACLFAPFHGRKMSCTSLKTHHFRFSTGCGRLLTLNHFSSPGSSGEFLWQPPFTGTIDDCWLGERLHSRMLATLLTWEGKCSGRGSVSLLVTKGISSKHPFVTRTKGHGFSSFCRENNAFATHCFPSLDREAHRSPKARHADYRKTTWPIPTERLAAQEK